MERLPFINNLQNIVKIVILPKAALHMKHNLPQNFNGILYRTKKQQKETKHPDILVETQNPNRRRHS